MIVGEKILEVTGKRLSTANITGLDLNISLENVKVNGEDVELDCEYTANYEKGVGYIKIKSTILAREDRKLAKEIDDEWKKSQKLPDEYAELILNAVNYSGSANGTLIARVLNLSAPLIPPKIQLTKK